MEGGRVRVVGGIRSHQANSPFSLVLGLMEVMDDAVPFSAVARP